MTNQESPVPMLSSWEEVREELNEQELEAATGGGLPLRRIKSEADLDRVRPLVSISPEGSPVAMSPGTTRNSPGETRERAGLIGTQRDPLILPENIYGRMDRLVAREA
jgi:hypothetical protein